MSNTYRHTISEHHGRPLRSINGDGHAMACEHRSCSSTGVLLALQTIEAVYCREHWGALGINVDAPVYVDHGGHGEIAVAGTARYSFPAYSR